MEEVKKYSVYVHTFPNGKKYVGMTAQSVEKRWGNGKAYSTQTKMSEAIKEFGWENVKHEVIFSGLTQTEANKQERELIFKYKTLDDNFGYNVSVGGTYKKELAYTGAKESYIMIKATEEEKRQVQKMAHKHEMNISQFVRWLIDKQRKEDENAKNNI